MAAEGCEEFAGYGVHEGSVVKILSGIQGLEAARHQDSFTRFEECTGIDIVWEGTELFESLLQERVAAGEGPDLAVIPQPGLLQKLARSGAVKPAAPEVTEQAAANYSQDWIDFGSVDGAYYAPPLGVNIKSLVWYSPRMFAENGWAIPQTLDELRTLSDTIAASGTKPWCVGIESGTATGWPMTDWVEDFMLRLQGVQVYDQWVSHEIAFNDPRVVETLDAVGSFVKNPDYVNGTFGDVASIATTAFKDAGLPILEGTCALHRQATFYANNWPAGTTIGPDGDVFVFYLPSVDASSKPVLGGAEFLGALNERPETAAVQRYLGSAEWVNARAALGEWITSHRALDVANVVSPVDKLAVERLQDPTAAFRFDASDMMPAAVGAGSFWTAMTDWINGASSADVLTAVESSWPQS
jgi:alpha-glucoside transport system substrate-binding protein